MVTRDRCHVLPRLSTPVAVPSGAGHEPAPADSTATVPASSDLPPVASSEAPSSAATLAQTAEQEVKDCSTEDGAKWIAMKARYRPPDNDLPGIVQGGDYGPIEAIEAFYVLASGTTRHGDFGIQHHREAKSDVSRIVITGTREPVIVELSEKRIRIGRRSFRDPKTISLFRTLGRLLADLGSECTQQGVRGIRIRNRSYRHTTNIEFSFGPVVVTLESDSNGPVNPVRIYVLDIVEPKDTFEWAPPLGSDPTPVKSPSW
jgi:hypothetical protein